MSAPLSDFEHYQDVLFTLNCILQLRSNSGAQQGIMKSPVDITPAAVLANCYYSVLTYAITHNSVSVSEHHKNSGAAYLRMHQHVKISCVRARACSKLMFKHVLK